VPNLSNPSRHDVEVALQALDIEDEREKALIRSFWARERRGLRLKVALLRIRAFMSKNRLYIGPVGPKPLVSVQGACRNRFCVGGTLVCSGFRLAMREYSGFMAGKGGSDASDA